MAELLEPGVSAPDMTFMVGRDQRGLAEFKGQKNVVLAFYAAAFTGGWERELVGFQQKAAEFEDLDTAIIASSTDRYPSQKAFADHCGVTYTVAADFPEHNMAKAFGVFNEERRTDKRVTFIIDKEGIIRHVIDEAQDMERHSREALEVIKSWRAQV